MTKPTDLSSFDVESARLNSLVDEAQTLIDELCAISRGQAGAIKSGDIEQIVEVVAKREPVVRGLVCVGEELNAFITDPDMIAKVCDTDRAQALKRIGSIEQTMVQLRERDAADQRSMESTRDGLANQLAGMGASKNALRAYSSRSATPNPILQDRRG